jgi:N-ethylmaleimide reductase
MSQLFTPVRIGRHTLRDRLVMAPMTRSRADDVGVSGDLVSVYYAQRASAGLIITEGVFPSAMGKGYVRTPGIVTDAQIAAWKKVTDAVHAQGGRIFMQLMHCGRISHPSLVALAERRTTRRAFGDQTGWPELDAQRLAGLCHAARIEPGRDRRRD